MQWTFRQLALVAMLVALWAPTSAVHAAESVDLQKYQGKVVILDFWASWCVPCRRSFPWLEEMQTKYASEGLVVIGVNLENDATAAQQFLDEFSPNFTIIYDTEKKLAQEYDVIAMPSSYVIARDGTTHARHLGYKVKLQADYEAAIVAALREKEL